MGLKCLANTIIIFFSAQRFIRLSEITWFLKFMMFCSLCSTTMYTKYRNEYYFSHFIKIIHTEATLNRRNYINRLCKTGTAASDSRLMVTNVHLHRRQTDERMDERLRNFIFIFKNILSNVCLIFCPLHCTDN